MVVLSRKFLYNYPTRVCYAEYFRIVTSYTAFSDLLGLHFEVICGVQNVDQAAKFILMI